MLEKLGTYLDDEVQRRAVIEASLSVAAKYGIGHINNSFQPTEGGHWVTAFPVPGEPEYMIIARLHGSFGDYHEYKRAPVYPPLAEIVKAAQSRPENVVFVSGNWALPDVEVRPYAGYEYLAKPENVIAG